MVNESARCWCLDPVSHECVRESGPLDIPVENAIFESQISCWKIEKYLFPFGATSVAQKNTLLFSVVTARSWLIDWLIDCGHDNRKVTVLCHTGCERMKTRENNNEKLKWTCVCVIASAQSAHCTHSAQSPIDGGSGRWCCSGAAYGRESYLRATECTRLVCISCVCISTNYTDWLGLVSCRNESGNRLERWEL